MALTDNLTGYFVTLRSIAMFFNVSINEGTFAKCWKMSNVIPVSKVKPKLRLDTVIRLISLNPTAGK